MCVWVMDNCCGGYVVRRRGVGFDSPGGGYAGGYVGEGLLEGGWLGLVVFFVIAIMYA